MSIVIEPTEIQAFMTCPRLWAYRYMESLKPKRVSVKLYLGNAIHAALHAHYSGRSWAQAYDTYVRDELKRIKDKVVLTAEEEQEFDTNSQLGGKLMAGYVETARTQDLDYFDKVLFLEQSFEIPIPGLEDVSLAGRMDMIVQDAWGQVWPMDHKSASQFPDALMLRKDFQFTAYVWAAHQLFPAYRIPGLIGNYLRKVDPSRARSEVYKKFRVSRTAEEVKSFGERTLPIVARSILEAREAYAKERYMVPYPGQHCSWRCGYTSLCLAEEDGSDVSSLVDGLFERVDRPNWLGDED